MPEQDSCTTYERHETAVDELAAKLRAVGLTEFHGPVTEPPELPMYSFARAPRRSVVPKLKVVPRDLVFRLDGSPISWKVYFAGDGVTHSSLYRSVAYQVLTRPFFLQTVTGVHSTPIEWLDDSLQGPLDHNTPTGVRGEGEVLDLIRSHLQPNA